MASTAESPLAGVKYLLFDVFGTVVDWRTSTARQLHEQCERTQAGASPEMAQSVRARAEAMGLGQWQDFTRQWLKAHSDMVWSIANANIDGREPPAFQTIDDFQLQSLPGMLKQWGLEGLWDEDTILRMSRALHRLDPWPDSVEGLKALNAAGFETVTLSNGNVELLQDMAANAKLEWTHVLSSAQFNSYKPDLKIYRGAASKLGARAGECALVAAHLYDLEGARKCGYRTVYVERPGEEAWDSESVEASKKWVDVWISENEQGLLAAAQRLGKATAV